MGKQGVIRKLIFGVMGFITVQVGVQVGVQASAIAKEAIQVQIDQAVPHGRFALGVGSRLTLKLPNHGKSDSGVFLGRLIEPNGNFNKYMLLDENDSNIYLADKDEVVMDASSYQPVLRQYDQVGGTCTGYAMDHFLQQMYWSGFTGNGKLRDALSTEKGRTELLVDAINEYYLVLQHRYSTLGVMKKYGTRFGFKCERKVFPDSDSATRYVVKKMDLGLPVMIGFDVGTDMVTSRYTVVDYGDPNQKMDARLWIPRKRGERQSGGHTVVGVGMFESHGHTDLLILDSDWSEPRVWDLGEYFTDRTAMDGVEFISCQ